METTTSQYKLDPCGVLIPISNHLIEDMNTIKKIATSLQDFKKSNQLPISNKSTNENSSEEEEESSLFELIFHTKTEEIITKSQQLQQQNDVFSPKNNGEGIGGGFNNNLINQSPIHQNQQHNFNVFSSSFVKTKKFKQNQQNLKTQQNQQSQKQQQSSNKHNEIISNNNKTDNNQNGAQDSFNKPPLSRISSFNKISLKKSAQKEDGKEGNNNTTTNISIESPHQQVKFADSVVDKSSVNNEEVVSNSNNSNFNNKSPFSKQSLQGGINSNNIINSYGNSIAFKNFKQYNPILPSKFQGGAVGSNQQYRNSQQVDMKNRNHILKMRNSGILHNLGNEFRKSLPFINPEQNKKNKKISFAIFGGENNSNNEDELNSSNEEGIDINSNNEAIKKSNNILPKSIYRQSLVDIMQKNSMKCNLELNNINFLNSPINSYNNEENENITSREDLDYQIEDSIVSEGDEYDEEEEEEKRKSIEQQGLKINVVRVDDYDLTSIINENKSTLYPKISNIQLTNAQLTKCNLNYQNCMPLVMRQALAYNDGAIDPLNQYEQVCKKQFLNQMVIYPFYIVSSQGISNQNSKFINNELHLIPKENENKEVFEKLINTSNQNLDNVCLHFGKIKLSEKKNQIATIQQVIQNEGALADSSSLMNSLTFKKGFLLAHQIQQNQLRTDFLEQTPHFALNVQNNTLFIRDLGSKTGTFVKLKNGHPIILNKSQLVMINSHAGFYLKNVVNTEGQLNDDFMISNNFANAKNINLNSASKNIFKDFSQEFFDESGEYDIVCINQVRSLNKGKETKLNQFSSENRKALRELIIKHKCPAIKLVFVKKTSELEMYEEYKTQIVIYNNNVKQNDYTKKNYMKFGYKEKVMVQQQQQQEHPVDNQQLQQKSPNLSQQTFHLIDQIVLPYDLFIGYDIFDKLWFLNSESKNATKLFLSAADKKSKILRFQHYNFVQQQFKKNPKPHHIKGLNLNLNTNNKNAIQQLETFDNTEFNVKNEEIEQFGPWVCITGNFSPLIENLETSEWLEIGNNAYVNYDSKVYQIKIGKFKQII